MLAYQEGSSPGVLVHPFPIYTVYKLLYFRASRCYNGSPVESQLWSLLSASCKASAIA